MTLSASGPISIADIKTEFGDRGNSLRDYYGVAPGVPASGAISLHDFYGKSAEFVLTLSSSTTTPNLKNMALAAGWNGSSKLVVAINATVCTLRVENSWSFPGGLRLNIGSGVLVGGNYGNGGNNDQNGVNGGTAIWTRQPVQIQNLGTIAGGGGGGAGGTSDSQGGWAGVVTCQGGTGGGGAGFGGVVASYRASPQSGTAGDSFYESGYSVNGGPGGSGGDLGQSGQSSGPQAGGLGGYYIDGNAYVTWLATGTRLGRVA